MITLHSNYLLWSCILSYKWICRSCKSLCCSNIDVFFFDVFSYTCIILEFLLETPFIHHFFFWGMDVCI